MQQFVGIPYVSHGRGYDGADCWGLLFLYYRDVLRLSIPSYSVEMASRRFCRQEIAPLMTAELLELWEKVGDPQPGNGVLMRAGRHETHVGVFLGNSRLLHSEGPHPSVIERMDTMRIRDRIVGFYRLKTC